METTSERSPRLLIFVTLLACSASSAPAREGVDPSPADSAAYQRFVDSGDADTLLAFARRAYHDAAGAAIGAPVDLPESGDRPAGPRDEPSPPEWPAGPAGLFICLRLDENVRACEGSRSPPNEDLTAGISDLAARLATSRTRGRQRAVKPIDRPRLSFEAGFVAGAVEVRTSGRRDLDLPAGIDPTQVGFVIESGEGVFVSLPGEVRSSRAALRMSARAGVKRSGETPPRVWIYRPIADTRATVFIP